MTAGRTLNSLSQHWGTPRQYVDAVRRVFGGIIALDPCSNKYSIVRAQIEYQLPDIDGLRAKWDFPTIYVNPPYGIDKERGTRIRDWLKRCADAYEQYGAEVIALIPVATNTSHWKDFVWDRATAICFLYDTRLKFLIDGRSGGKGAPMSCAMVYWGRRYSQFSQVFAEYGAVVDLRALQETGTKPVSRSRQVSLFEEIEQARRRYLRR